MSKSVLRILKLYQNTLKKNVVYLVLSIVIAMIVFIFKTFYIKDGLFTEGSSCLDKLYAIQTFLIMLSSLFFVVFVVKLTTILQYQEVDSYFDTFRNCIKWGVLLLSVLFLLIFVFMPRIFDLMCLEDGLIENLSMVLHLLSCWVFIFIFLLFLKKDIEHRWVYMTTLLTFAFVFFVMGMEEVSWCQRYLSIKTPEVFRANMQGEINLHNFATETVENIYYFSTFLFFAVFSFVYDKTHLSKGNKCISFFIPSRFILFISAILLAYNYEPWPFPVYIQFGFFITLHILVHYVWSAFKGVNDLSKEKYYLSALLTVYILTQALLIVRGNTFLRSWDTTEYKEFFIPLSFFIYSLEVLHKVSHVNSQKISTITITSQRADYHQ